MIILMKWRRTEKSHSQTWRSKVKIYYLKNLFLFVRETLRIFVLRGG